jgi:hypothetical protein
MTRRIIVTALKISAALLLIAIIGLSIFLRIEQYRLRRKAEAIIWDMRTLLTSDRSAARVDEFAKKWNFEGAPCSLDRCSYRLTLTNRTVASRRHLDEGRAYQWNRTLFNFTRALGAPITNIDFQMGVRNGVVDFSSVLVELEITQREEYPSFLWGEAVLFDGDIGTQQAPSKLLALRAEHPGFVIEKHRGLTNLDTFGPIYALYNLRAQLSLKAQPSDIARLMQFNLDCITRLRSCTEKDLMPTSWEQWEADEKIPVTDPACSAAVLDRVASIADFSVIFRVNSLDLEIPATYGPTRLIRTEFKTLVGARNTRYRFHGIPEQSSREVPRTGDTNQRIRVGREYIFFLHDQFYGQRPVRAIYPCGILEVTPANLALAKRVGTP